MKKARLDDPKGKGRDIHNDNRVPQPEVANREGLPMLPLSRG